MNEWGRRWWRKMVEEEGEGDGIECAKGTVFGVNAMSLLR